MDAEMIRLILVVAVLTTLALAILWYGSAAKKS